MRKIQLVEPPFWEATTRLHPFTWVWPNIHKKRAGGAVSHRPIGHIKYIATLNHANIWYRYSYYEFPNEWLGNNIRTWFSKKKKEMISCPKKTISCLCRIFEFVFTNKIDQIYEREREREREFSDSESKLKLFSWNMNLGLCLLHSSNNYIYWVTIASKVCCGKN